MIHSVVKLKEVVEALSMFEAFIFKLLLFFLLRLFILNPFSLGFKICTVLSDYFWIVLLPFLSPLLACFKLIFFFENHLSFILRRSR